uniref:Ig-like domain-containing protein n=1 Tax=Timema tahoe TaxID=61484 RepID=A0A7R9NWB0_9NEOP|nr:unnamed protein product [Timema tahoe]
MRKKGSVCSCVPDLPDGDPRLVVEKTRYSVGDMVRANCSSPPSNPGLNLTWVVNGKKTKVSSYQQSVSRNSRESNERMVTSISLEMEISASSFQYGKVRLQCLATMFQLYRGEVEVVLEEERPRPASVLGTRETSVAGPTGVMVRAPGYESWSLGFNSRPVPWVFFPDRHCSEVARYLLVPATNGASIGVQQVARILNLVLRDAVCSVSRFLMTRTSCSARFTLPYPNTLLATSESSHGISKPFRYFLQDVRSNLNFLYLSSHDPSTRPRPAHPTSITIQGGRCLKTTSHRLGSLEKADLDFAAAFIQVELGLRNLREKIGEKTVRGENGTARRSFVQEFLGPKIFIDNVTHFKQYSSRRNM